MFTKQNTKQKFTNTLCLQNKIQNKSIQTRYVYKTKQMFTTQMFTKQKFTNTLCLQNKIQNKSLQHKCLQSKTTVYKHVMFTKQNTKQKFRTGYVYKTKQMFTEQMFTKQKFWTSYVCKTKYKTECLENKYLQTSYVYKTKYKTESLQNKTKVYIQVMFIKQVMFTKLNTKQKYTNTLCLLNKTNVYNTNVYKTRYKTKVYQDVMFTKQNKCLQTRYVY